MPKRYRPTCCVQRDLQSHLSITYFKNSTTTGRYTVQKQCFPSLGRNHSSSGSSRLFCKHAISKRVKTISSGTPKFKKGEQQSIEASHNSHHPHTQIVKYSHILPCWCFRPFRRQIVKDRTLARWKSNLLSSAVRRLALSYYHILGLFRHDNLLPCSERYGVFCRSNAGASPVPGCATACLLYTSPSPRDS